MRQKALDTFRWRLEESHSRSGIARPRLCLVNPAIIHSTQFFRPTCSISLLGTPAMHEYGIDQLENSLAPIVGCVEAIDQKIHSEIANRDYDHAQLSVQLIDTSSSRKSELIMQQIIRYKIVEQLLWAKGEKAATIPFQRPPKYIVESTELEHAELGLTNWKATVDEFCTTFTNHHAPAPSHIPSVRDDVIASLVHNIQVSETTRHHSTVISNMCGAALGLRGLILVRRVRSTFFLEYYILKNAAV